MLPRALGAVLLWALVLDVGHTESRGASPTMASFLSGSPTLSWGRCAAEAGPRIRPGGRAGAGSGPFGLIPRSSRERWGRDSQGIVGALGVAACSGSEGGEKALEKALDRRRRSRETPLSQAWFKQRQRTITPPQKKALRDLWGAFGVTVEHDRVFEVEGLFPGAGARRTVLDIGFGAGDSIVGMARADREALFLGVELHKSSIATTLQQLQASNLTNVRVFRYDAAKLLGEHMRGACLDEVCILFPDPWINARDEQRRMLRDGTAALLAQRVRPGGLLRIATDVEAYASHAEEVLGRRGDVWQLAFKDEHTPCEGGPAWRPVTRYERRAAELGHRVWELEYERVGD